MGWGLDRALFKSERSVERSVIGLSVTLATPRAQRRARGRRESGTKSPVKHGKAIQMVLRKEWASEIKSSADSNLRNPSPGALLCNRRGCNLVMQTGYETKTMNFHRFRR